MVRTVRHTGIVVSDMEKALFFYRDLLGIGKVAFDGIVQGDFFDRITAVPGAKIRGVMLVAPDGNRIELLQYLSHRREAPRNVESFDIGCSHPCFGVDDVDAMYEKMRAAGVRFNATPTIDKTGYAKVTYCHDFDGTVVELTEVLDDSKSVYED